jgi:hypothetical protein
MQSHRSTQPTVPNHSPDSNFAPGTALENLRAEMIDIEALARAAEAAADALPTPTSDRQRLVFGRIQSLTAKASHQAGASLRFANAQVAAHTAQMEARRKAAPR